MIFVSLALLVAGPVHKERYMQVHHEHGDEHVHNDAEGGDARKESKNQSQTAEKFRTDREKREWRGNVHLRGEESHGSRKAVPTKPAQEFFGSLGLIFGFLTRIAAFGIVMNMLVAVL